MKLSTCPKVHFSGRKFIVFVRVSKGFNKKSRVVVFKHYCMSESLGEFTEMQIAGLHLQGFCSSRDRFGFRILISHKFLNDVDATD